MSNTQEQPACGGSALTAELGTRFFGLGPAIAVVKCNTCGSTLKETPRWGPSYSCDTCNAWTANVRIERKPLISMTCA